MKTTKTTAQLVAELLALAVILQDSGCRRPDTKSLIARFIEIEKQLGFIGHGRFTEYSYAIRAQVYLGKRSEYVFFKDVLALAAK